MLLPNVHPQGQPCWQDSTHLGRPGSKALWWNQPLQARDAKAGDRQISARWLKHFYQDFTPNTQRGGLCNSYGEFWTKCPLLTALFSLSPFLLLPIGGNFLGFLKKKRKVLRIIWNGEKNGQKKNSPPPPSDTCAETFLLVSMGLSGGSSVRRPLSKDPHRRQRKLKCAHRTFQVGKWHLGYCHPDFLPVNRGFDSFFGQYTHKTDYYTR